MAEKPKKSEKEKQEELKGLAASKRIVSHFFELVFDPKVLYVFFFFAVIITICFLIGQPLTPIFISLCVVYLLDGFVSYLETKNVPRWLGATICFLVASAIFALLAVFVVPFLSRQVLKASNELPRYLNQFSEMINDLISLVKSQFPNLDLDEARNQINNRIQFIATWFTKNIVVLLTNQIRLMAANSIELVIILFLSFFILKDKMKIKSWLEESLPGNHELLTRILRAVDIDVGQFIKGKLIVVSILWVISWVVYLIAGLKFDFVMAFLTGISTLIPFVGATIVFFPVAFLGFLQFGFSTKWLVLLIGYGIVQFIDANILTPVIIGYHTRLHPVGIIVALVICGALWGIWGGFFAVPILILIKSILENIHSYLYAENPEPE